jgi:hypothetical protein
VASDRHDYPPAEPGHDVAVPAQRSAQRSRPGPPLLLTDRNLAITAATWRSPTIGAWTCGQTPMIEVGARASGITRADRAARTAVTVRRAAGHCRPPTLQSKYSAPHQCSLGGCSWRTERRLGERSPPTSGVTQRHAQDRSRSDLSPDQVQRDRPVGGQRRSQREVLPGAAPGHGRLRRGRPDAPYAADEGASAWPAVANLQECLMGQL